MCKQKWLILLLLLQVYFGCAQSQVSLFLRPSDTLNKSRLITTVITQAVFLSATTFKLNQYYYKNYPKSDFHFVDDSAEWLQMDKMGLIFSSYHIGNAAANSLKWAGLSKKKQLLYGATLGFAYLSAVEVLDGFSTQYGASWTDIAANAGGAGLYIAQELIWNEQRIVPKFSFHATPYASAQPNILGKSFGEQILKDYNGQTYWFSGNLHSFLKQSKIPKWLNLAFGYGAEGMITANDELVNTVFMPEKQRTRQFYLSFDVCLTKIPTKNRTLKTLFAVFNTIKIPAPTFEINQRGQSKWHLFYF